MWTLVQRGPWAGKTPPLNICSARGRAQGPAHHSPETLWLPRCGQGHVWASWAQTPGGAAGPRPGLEDSHPRPRETSEGAEGVPLPSALPLPRSLSGHLPQLASSPLWAWARAGGTGGAGQGDACGGCRPRRSRRGARAGQPSGALPGQCWGHESGRTLVGPLSLSETCSGPSSLLMSWPVLGLRGDRGDRGTAGRMREAVGSGIVGQLVGSCLWPLPPLEPGQAPVEKGPLGQGWL